MPKSCSRLLMAAALLCAVLLFTSAAIAQTFYGSMVGTVTDPKGA